MSETPDYAELTDYAIEQSAQGEYTPGQFDLNRDEPVDPTLFDRMNATRESDVKAARDNAISLFESEQAALTPQMELKTTNEYVAGIASMSYSIVNARNVQLGLVSAKHLNPMPFEAQQRQSAVDTAGYDSNANVMQFRPRSQSNEQLVTRSYEDPQSQDYYRRTAA